MPVRLGIRGKIALLVVVSAAVVATLVAVLLSRVSEDLLRQHELVDLGDEAHVRATEITDRVDGLREDANVFAYDTDFHAALSDSGDADKLREICRRLSRRYWIRYLRIDVVSIDESGQYSDPLLIEEKAGIAENDVWLPRRDKLASARGVLLSEIQRVAIKRSGEDQRWEPVVWACAPLEQFDSPAGAGAAPLLRILMTVDEPPSSRHFFSLADSENRLLVRPDEFLSEDADNNDHVFRGIAQDKEVQKRFHAKPPPEEAGLEEPQIERLLLRENISLRVPYYFREGIPGQKLAAAIAAEDPDRFDDFIEELRSRFAPAGRIGGLRNAVREVRLLAASEEGLEALQEKTVEVLEERFGDAFDGIDWRRPVDCDEIHAWTVRMGLGTLDEKTRYLLVYAVMDDELASSIRQELAYLQGLALAIAAFAGVIAFLVSMYFVGPLKRMTEMAQRVTGTASDRLAGQLRRLTDLLPVKRSDEVGDIAKASKRLFEEVLQSQEKLEERVRERTARLAQANLDLETANDKLKSLSREKDAFVAKVSHDLRQPLNAIFLQVEALKLSELDGQQVTDVQKIHDHAARELTLVNDILEYQKIIMGADTLSRDSIEVAALMDDLEDGFSRAAAEKGVGFVCEYDGEIGVLEADRKRLRQVFDNLIGNACKFTSEGSVTIEAHARTISGDKWIEFNVQDTGRGMDEDEQARAFVPFVSNKTANEGGTGLGLSICKELCLQMGGKIGFVSEPGKGTHFTVMLPRTAGSSRYDNGAADLEPEIETESKEEESNADSDTGPVSVPADGTVLVVDDDESVRELIRRLLEAEGFTVITAATGDEGLELARSRIPDVITLDVVMPGEDGWQVLGQLKDDLATESIPVVMVSVMAENAEGIALGVEDYLVKPIDRKRLIRAVRKAAAKRRQTTGATDG